MVTVISQGDFVWACKQLQAGKTPYYYSTTHDGRECKRWLQLLGEGRDKSICVEQGAGGDWFSCGSDPFLEDYLATYTVVSEEEA